MDEDEKQLVIDLEADLVDLNDNLDSFNKIPAGTKLAEEERADKEKLKANFERRIAAKARARLLIFGDRNFKTPVIEAASSNASAGDMALTHLNNDFNEQREIARRALLLEQEGSEARRYIITTVTGMIFQKLRQSAFL